MMFSITAGQAVFDMNFKRKRFWILDLYKRCFAYHSVEGGCKMRINSMKHIFWGFLLIVLVTGCQSAAVHKQQVQDDSGERVTVGKVQKEIRIGMSGAAVAQVLGSPNIVSTDEERREVWIYDKIATDHAYSESRGGVMALILGWGGSAAGAASGNVSSSAGASSTSQRTLTIIIKFDKEGIVRDFAYHTSRF